MSAPFPDRYQPGEVEPRIYKWWEERGKFKALDKSTKPPYCIILPPPNVTGFLHLGHALDHAIQDCLIRWKRMSGFNALWLPGTDHAGIATQAVVEKELRKENTDRRTLGREKFVARVWDWKNQFGERIYNQMRALGNSCDWERACFTLDPGVSKAVRKVFVALYKKNALYRGTRLVNWSGPLETAISDLEVEHKTVKGTLWTIRYPLSSGEHLLVATTRPETLLGDTALCVHPEDARYKHLIGHQAIVPFLNRPIPIIADTYVDPQFGSGVVKITPAHDFNDYKVGKTHGLPMINILTRQCHLNEEAGPYQNLSVQEARKKIVADLAAAGLLEKEEPHTLNVGHCQRSGAVVEPFLSEQWFVKTSELSVPAKRVVESGTLTIEPESWTKVYLHWMNIIEDWCISRQLWWGHRIPAWHCGACGHITVSETDPGECEKCHAKDIHQDEDVLDTWFSSALWPFSTLGWPEQTESLKTFYPTSTLVTGHDILFFWVSRMVMMGLEFGRDVPFRTVYLHGMIRDSQGKKMSKSAGNSVDPLELIQKYGADALRFSFLAHTFAGRDFKFSEQRTEGYRNFMNKVWNASRFALAFKPTDPKLTELTPNKTALSIFDQWIIGRLKACVESVQMALEQHRFADAAQSLYNFAWYEFCDWYIELAKPILSGPPSEERNATVFTLFNVLNRLLRTMHPFAPFITEEIYQYLPNKKEACITDDFPVIHNDSEFYSLAKAQSVFEVDVVKNILTAIRNIRGENRISPATKLNVRLQVEDDQSQKIVLSHRDTVVNLGRIDQLLIETKAEAKSMQKCAVAPVVLGQTELQVIIPLEGLVDLAEERKRLQKNLDKLGKERFGIEARLDNENFLKNASEDVVEGDRQALAAIIKEVQSLSAAIARLSDDQ